MTTPKTAREILSELQAIPHVNYEAGILAALKIIGDSQDAHWNAAIEAALSQCHDCGSGFIGARNAIHQLLRPTK